MLARNDRIEQNLQKLESNWKKKIIRTKLT